MKVLRHAHIITMDDTQTTFDDGYLVIDKGMIAALGLERDIPAMYANAEGEDLGGQFVYPGMVNLHTHLGMVSFRSLADDYPDRLHRFLMPLENEAMTRQLAKASTKLAIAESLLSGVTAAVDMYYFESAVAEAAAEMGFRLWAGETYLDSPRPDGTGFESAMRETEKIIALANPLIHAIVSPHAPYSMSFDNLAKSYRYAVDRDLLWTTHFAELPIERMQYEKEYGMGLVEKLEKEGMLSSRLLAAHVLLVDNDDIAILGEHQVNIAHCPGSNAKAAKGVAPVPELLSAGALAGLGTDGPASGNTLDLFTQLKLYAVLQKNRLKDRGAVPAKEIVPLATSNAGRILSSPIGQLKAGYQADIMVLSSQRPNMVPLYDPYSVLVYSAQSQNVRDVYVAGVQRVKEGCLFGIDYPKLLSEFQEASAGFEASARKRL